MSFKVGDQIRSKGITSPAVEGKVVGIMSARYYQAVLRPLPYWIYDGYFKDWYSKSIVIVQKSIPTNSAFGGSPEQIVAAQQNPFLSYAEDELEVVPPGHSWIDEIEKKLGE